MKVYNAENQILGRMATQVAKDLIKGEHVHIVNCEKARISGKPTSTKEKYFQRRKRGDPKHGPHYPRTPSGLVRRTVRGMLPINIKKGQEALRRLEVYTGFPKKLETQKPIKLKNSDAERLKCKSISIEELSLWLGAKKRW